MSSTTPQNADSWVVIDTEAVRHNVALLTRAAGQAKKVMVMVKANAYGHGAIEMARFFQKIGATYVGVARYEEACELRKHNVSVPIMLFADPPDIPLATLQKSRITPVIGSVECLRRIGAELAECALPFHLKVNTGFNRFGVQLSELPELINILQASNLRPQGILTHYSSAPDDDRRTLQEFEKFRAVLRALENVNVHPHYVHASNSAAAYWFKEDTSNLIRLGLAAYGLQPTNTRHINLRQALTWKSHIQVINTLQPGDSVGYGRSWQASKKQRVGILPVGYCDGFRKSPIDFGFVLCKGKKVPVLTVLMSHSIIDLSSLAGARVDDEIVLIGSQNEEVITLESIADHTGTINEEIVTNISSKIPRFYV